MRPTLVLIHGAWMNPDSWQPWIERYQARGYTVVAPAWPYDDAPAATLRANPNPALGDVGIPEIVEHYAKVIQALSGPVVLIGHSFGGLFVQLLLDRGLGVAGVAIDPAPAKGITPGFDALRAALPVVVGTRAVATMTFEQFQWGWAHLQPEAEQRAAFETFVVPTPAKPYRQGAALFGDIAKVRFGERRQPLLLIAGVEDRTVTVGMVRATYRQQKRSAAPTALHEFPGRTHWLIGQPGWEEIADDAIGWVEGQLAASSGETG